MTLETSIDPVTTQDANAHLQSDMTYRIAARPTSHNVLHGRVKDSVITTDPAAITMSCDAYIQPVYEFLEARMRLKIGGGYRQLRSHGIADARSLSNRCAGRCSQNSGRARQGGHHILAALAIERSRGP